MLAANRICLTCGHCRCGSRCCDDPCPCLAESIAAARKRLAEIYQIPDLLGSFGTRPAGAVEADLAVSTNLDATPPTAQDAGHESPRIVDGDAPLAPREITVTLTDGRVFKGIEQSPLTEGLDTPSILAEADALVSGQRASDHGAWEETAQQTSDLFESMTGAHVGPEDVALFMVALKLARAAQRPENRDNWVDAAGYLRLAQEASG